MNPLHIWMTAAHAGYGSDLVPVGGAAAVCERLCTAWGGRDDVTLTVVGSGPRAPAGVDYIRLPLLDRPPCALPELAYARFCRAFERSATERLLAAEPRPVVVVHDLSEGPDFRALRQAGIPTVALVHVDVVEYFTRFYLGGLVSAPRAARLWASLGRLPVVPDLLRLVFDKQGAAATHCRALIVPSQPMQHVLTRCYPDLSAERIHVLPWGAPDRPADSAAVAQARATLQATWGLPRQGLVLLTLSRISPEKGQDLMLEAIAVGETRGEVPSDLRVAICGAPAYMRGARFYRRLQRIAARLHTPVYFPGHVDEATRQAAFELASIFVAPSRHESYGLTTMEAMAAGLPVVALRSHGTEATLDDTCGVEVLPGRDMRQRLWVALRDLLHSPEERSRKSAGAHRRAAAAPFAETAARLLEMLRELAPP